MQQFGTKTPWETRNYEMDFSQLLAADETITGVTTVSVSVLSGTDPDPSAMILGGASIDSTGKIVMQSLIGGIDGVQYLVSYQVNSNEREGIEGQAGLPVNAVLR